MAVNTVINNGNSDNRIDIIFLGDGYQSNEISTTYYNHISGLTDYMFSGAALSEPFGRYKNFFNVHAIEVISNESGADDPVNNITRDTALNSTYLYDGETDRLLSIEDSIAEGIVDAALNGTNIDSEIQLVTVNSSKYGGAGGPWATYAGGNSDAYEVALHELGHSFVGLADEYGGFTTAYTGAEPSEINTTTDSTGAKWSHWLGYTEAGLGTVGAFEGGRYYDTGIFRPTNSSKMRDVGTPFDAISREAFVLKFYELIDPLDTYTNKGGSLSITDPMTLSVTPIDTSVISVEWKVDGTIMGGNGTTLDLFNLNLAIGSHNVQVRAFDDTDWVRLDRSSLEDNVSWSVNVTNHDVNGTSNGETLNGNALMNTITGLGGDDILAGAAGSDTLDGGTGTDTAVFEGTAMWTVNLSIGTATNGIDTDTLVSIEHVITGSGNDTIFGSTGSDTIEGGAGNDTLVGNATAAAQIVDTLIGGAGDDTFYAEFTDTIMGGAGRDVLYQVNDYEMTIDLGTTSIEYMLGGFNDDTINAATQTVGVEVYSGGGNDEITGSDFNDFLFSGVGDDIVNAGGGDDVILGDLGADQLSGGAGNDSIHVDALDTFSGGTGFDALYIGGDTGLTVDMAATGFEWLRGSIVGGDTVDASSQTVAVNVYAAGGNDMVTGSAFNDFLWGEAGNDTLIGNNGDDVLVGGLGADTMTGGLGFDVLFANSGGGNDGAVDTFVMTANWGTDILFDFENGTDKIDMTALSTNFAALTVTADGAHAHIRLGSDLISVANSAGLIDAGDFIF